MSKRSSTVAPFQTRLFDPAHIQSAPAPAPPAKAILPANPPTVKHPSSFPITPGKEAPASYKSETSQAAAKSIRHDLGPLQKRVLSHLRKSASTQHEIAGALGLLHSTVCGRVNELCRAGLVRDSGQRRLTPSQRRAVVWTAVLSEPLS